jgi:phosphatidylserine/phosphatidylglycerophosphate/cardiolipin synthase-like enzyme
MLCSLVLLVLLATAATGLRAEVQVFFSPRGGADEALTSLARSARMYLDAACYTFSLESVANELVAAHDRGVRVRVILDRGQGAQAWSQGEKLLAAGVPVLVNTHSGLMHDKFLVADGASIATGSFNWTKAAIERNDENLVVFTGEPKVAGAFAVQFESMWTDTARYAPLAARAGPGQAGEHQPAVAPTQKPPGADADTVYITRTGTKYHRAGCRHLARSSVAISRKEAEARGYAPCKVCKP